MKLFCLSILTVLPRVQVSYSHFIVFHKPVLLHVSTQSIIFIGSRFTLRGTSELSWQCCDSVQPSQKGACFLFYFGCVQGKYFSLYHDIENTANQNTGKPLYIQWH